MIKPQNFERAGEGTFCSNRGSRAVEPGRLLKSPKKCNSRKNTIWKNGDARRINATIKSIQLRGFGVTYSAAIPVRKVRQIVGGALRELELGRCRKELRDYIADEIGALCVPVSPTVECGIGELQTGKLIMVCGADRRWRQHILIHSHISGAQNNIRYAVFPQRLAAELTISGAGLRPAPQTNFAVAEYVDYNGGFQ